MNKVFKKLLKFLFVLLAGSILFMNVTPGHFQGVPCCGIGYVTDEKAKRMWSVVDCSFSDCRSNVLVDSVTYFLSYLDLNK
jgi:hypothetical protein